MVPIDFVNLMVDYLFKCFAFAPTQHTVSFDAKFPSIWKSLDVRCFVAVDWRLDLLNCKQKQIDSFSNEIMTFLQIIC